MDANCKQLGSGLHGKEFTPLLEGVGLLRAITDVYEKVFRVLVTGLIQLLCLAGSLLQVIRRVGGTGRGGWYGMHIVTNLISLFFFATDLTIERER